MSPASTTLDPTLLALLSIFGGVAVTVVAGLVGAWIQGRREHRRWLRERRLEAWSGLLTLLRLQPLHGEAIDKIVAAFEDGPPSRLKSTDERLRSWGASRVESIFSKSQDSQDSIVAAVTAVMLLGPLDAVDALFNHLHERDEGTEEASEQAFGELILRVRAALGP